MSSDARLALTVVCFAVALLAEVGAVLLLAKEARAAGRALRRWRAEGRKAEEADVLEQLLGNRFDRSAAVVLLVGGIVAGGVGDFLSL
jgi:hypothetical protein